jgi:hypothetical protein
MLGGEASAEQKWIRKANSSIRDDSISVGTEGVISMSATGFGLTSNLTKPFQATVRAGAASDSSQWCERWSGNAVPQHLMRSKLCKHSQRSAGGGVGSMGRSLTREPAKLRKPGHDGHTTSRFDCYKQGCATITLQSNLRPHIESCEDCFEYLVVSRVLRLGISHKGLAQQATKRHFGHASQAMFASYGHTQCVAPEFLEQDARVRTPTSFTIRQT